MGWGQLLNIIWWLLEPWWTFLLYIRFCSYSGAHTMRPNHWMSSRKALNKMATPEPQTAIFLFLTMNIFSSNMPFSTPCVWLKDSGAEQCEDTSEVSKRMEQHRRIRGCPAYWHHPVVEEYLSTCHVLPDLQASNKNQGWDSNKWVIILMLG
jgi:hypothetical protein